MLMLHKALIVMIFREFKGLVGRALLTLVPLPFSTNVTAFDALLRAGIFVVLSDRT